MININSYNDYSKDELIDIILVSKLEKEKLLEIIQLNNPKVFSKIKEHGILSNKYNKSEMSLYGGK